MPNPVDEQIGRQIRSLRKSKAFTEEDLASRIGVSSQQVRRYERGTSRASLGRLSLIADALGAPLSALFDGCASPSPGNDNIPAANLTAKQGLILLKHFHSIQDNNLRCRALEFVEALASGRFSELSER